MAAVDDFKDAVSRHDDLTVLDRFYYGRQADRLAPDCESELRREIATKFQIGIRDVIITGSAKLGFTLMDKSDEGRPMFSSFGDTSDIDVTIISQALFLKFWRRTFEYLQEKKKWDNASGFRKYLSRGWIRPDKLPRDPEFPEQAEWFNFFRDLQASGRFGPYKISAGIYYDELFWERYASQAIAECRRTLELMA